jgi:hypothetical protein
VKYHIGLTKNTKEIAAINALAASALVLIGLANKPWIRHKNAFAGRNLSRRSATNTIRSTKYVKITSDVVSVKYAIKFVGANQSKRANRNQKLNMSVMSDSAKSVWVI